MSDVITGIGILLLVAFYVLFFIGIIAQKLVYKYGKTKSVRAEVISKYRTNHISYKGAGTKVECGVVFKTEKGKKLSFRVSELSYNSYKKGEQGILKYKAGRLIDFI